MKTSHITTTPSGEKKTWKIGERAIWIDYGWIHENTIGQTVFDGIITAFLETHRGVSVSLGQQHRPDSPSDDQIGRLGWIEISELYEPNGEYYGIVKHNSSYDLLEQQFGFVPRVWNVESPHQNSDQRWFGQPMMDYLRAEGFF
jgi:hypothetical protein